MFIRKLGLAHSRASVQETILFFLSPSTYLIGLLKEKNEVDRSKV